MKEYYCMTCRAGMHTDGTLTCPTCGREMVEHISPADRILRAIFKEF